MDTGSNSDMITFLKKVAKFITGLPIVYVLFIIICGTILPPKYTKNLISSKGHSFMSLRLDEAKTTRAIDVLVVGSSHAYRGIDPRIMSEHGISAFNLGSSLQSPIQTEYLLKKFLDKMNPKVVLIEVGFKSFSSDGVEGALDIINNVDRIDKDLLAMAIEINDFTVYNTLVFAFFTKNILGDSAAENQQAPDKDDRYVSGGFVETKKKTYRGSLTFFKETKPLYPNQKRSFSRILKRLEEKNVKVLLVQTPILNNYYLALENRKEYDDYFHESVSHGHFLNFSDSCYRSTEFFYDFHHMNGNGVSRFNKSLLKGIQPHIGALSEVK